MPRATNNVAARARHHKLLKQAEGYYGAKSRLYRIAKEAVERGLNYAYRDRRARKRDFRQLWIMRINAAARQHGLSYSTFMGLLRQSNIEVNRKVLAEMAVNDAEAFEKLVETAKQAQS
ncbi:MAG TPA: 50S ribosomal protein L20 [Candidatus Krumholzibacteria bacterium]|jgi:large subunit ribosomal protein L20|nr:50S ribosomal protein L20 [Candidatus Krumholzibacteria bacterium]